MNCNEAEILLHARLDEELDAAGLIGIEKHLEQCRLCSAQYEALRGLKNQIRNSRLDYPLRPQLETRLASRFLRVESRTWWHPAYAVAAALCVIAIVAIPVIRSGMQTNDVAKEILDDHLRALEPGHLFDVPSSDQHTVKPWFQGRTPFSPPVPDLSNDGFVLTGGRLGVVDQQATAVIVYRRRQHVVDLYVSPSGDKDSSPKATDLSGYHLLHWTQSHLSYWAVSDVAPADLRDFSTLVNRP